MDKHELRVTKIYEIAKRIDFKKTPAQAILEIMAKYGVARRIAREYYLVAIQIKKNGELK